MGRGRGREETGRSKEQDIVYITKKLPVSDSGEPVLPIIAAPRRPRDSPSSSHATRTSSDRPGPVRLDAPAAAATHRSSVTAALRTRARLSRSPRPSFALDPTWGKLHPLVLSSSTVLSFRLGSLFSSGLNMFRVRSSSSSSSLLERVS